MATECNVYATINLSTRFYNRVGQITADGDVPILLLSLTVINLYILLYSIQRDRVDIRKVNGASK
jgi:hypothetical protein